MRKISIIGLILLVLASCNREHDVLPVRGFFIDAPSPKGVDAFIKFIDEELAPRNVNTLVLRIDYGYQFKSHPEIANSAGLSEDDAKKLLEACRKHNINLIPHLNLMGHQSWGGGVGSLLKAYPEFDETPHIILPENYIWPNADSLYCKSYCPLHPDVHRVVFDIVDEMCDAFEAEMFHGGFDEVFYLGSDSCKRCAGHSKAELFANEVNCIRDHLAMSDRQLWIWGDRLLDGRATGMGIWEGSLNNTWPAVDMIKKDVVICDWHYETPYESAAFFAEKGFKVVTCPWRISKCAIKQTRLMRRFRREATEDVRDNYLGMMQTVWSGSEKFLESYYGKDESKRRSEAHCFRELYKEINRAE